MPANDNELGILILAGGGSQRMGMDKALLPFEGRTFIECLVAQCCRGSSHVVISVGQDRQQALRKRFESTPLFSGVTWVADQHNAKGPLAGIEAGLRALEPVCRYAFVTGCDVPVLKLELTAELLKIAKQQNSRAVTPVDGQRTFGMTAVYRTDSWRAANELIQQHSLRVSNLAAKLCATKVELADLRDIDSELVSFLNINHPKAYQDFLISQGYDVDSDLIEKLSNSAK